MKAILATLAILMATVGCSNRSMPEEVEWEGWPPGTVMAAHESKATHRMTLTFSIDGHLGEQSHDFFFRVLQEPGEMETGLPSSAAHADGGGGGYSLYVHPSPSSVFESNRVSFAITFNKTQDGEKAVVEESVDVPLFRSSSGQTGLVRFRTDWKAEPEN